jgi:hypothetical protein
VRFRYQIPGFVLLVGGGLEVLQLSFTDLVSIPAPPWTIALLYGIPPTVIGAGIIALGIKIERPVRLAFFVSGAGLLLAAAINDSQLITGSRDLFLAAFLISAISSVSLSIAAVVLWRDRTQAHSVRYAMLFPAAGFVLYALTQFLPQLSWYNVLLGIGFVATGVTLIREGRTETGGDSGRRPAERVVPELRV